MPTNDDLLNEGLISYSEWMRREQDDAAWENADEIYEMKREDDE